MTRRIHYIIPLLFSPLLLLASCGQNRVQVAPTTSAITTADVTRINDLITENKQSITTDPARVSQTIRTLAEQQARDSVRLRYLENLLQQPGASMDNDAVITPPDITLTPEQLAKNQSMQQVVTQSLYRLRDHRITSLALAEYITSIQGIIDKLLEYVNRRDVLRQSLHIAQRDREYNQQLLIKAQNSNWSTTREVLLYTLGFKWLWGMFTGYALSADTANQTASLAAADQRVYQSTNEQAAGMVEMTAHVYELLDKLTETVRQVPMVALDPHWGINHTNLVYEFIYRIRQLFPTATTDQLRAVFTPLLTDIKDTLAAIHHVEQQFIMYANYYNRVIKAEHAQDSHVDLITVAPDELWTGLPPRMPVYTLAQQEKIASEYNAAYANILETARAYAAISNILTNLRATQQLVGEIRRLIDQRNRVFTMISTDLLSYLDAYHNNWSFGSEIMLYLFGFKWFWGIFTHWSPTTFTRNAFNRLYHQRSNAATSLAQLDRDYVDLLKQYQAAHIRTLMVIRDARRILANDKFIGRIRGIALTYYTQHKSFLDVSARIATEYARLTDMLMRPGGESNVGNMLITRSNMITDEEYLRSYNHYLASVTQFSKMVDDVSQELINNYADVLSQSFIDYAAVAANYRIIVDLNNSNATDALMSMPPMFAQIYQDVINSSPLIKPDAEISELVSSRLVAFFDRWLTPRTMTIQEHHDSSAAAAESAEKTVDETASPNKSGASNTPNVDSSPDSNTLKQVVGQSVQTVESEQEEG